MTTVQKDSQELRYQIDKFKQSRDDYTILGAQNEFEASNINIVNPKLIDEEIQHQKEIFSKLKFIYLEQETRDKFLRKISELTTDEIDKSDVQQIEEASLQRKNEFKTLKTQMNQKIESLNKTAHENIDLYDTYQEKLGAADKLIEDLADLEKDLDQILDQTLKEAPVDQALKLETSSQVINSLAEYVNEDSNLEQILELNSQELVHEKSLLDQLDEEINTKRNTIISQEHVIKASSEKLEELRSSVLSSQPHASNDSFQRYAKWCKEMNDILVKFTDIVSLKFSYDQSKSLQLELEGPTQNSIVSWKFDENFKVLETNGFTFTESDIVSFNKLSLDEGRFIKELAALINRSVLG